MPQYNLTGPQQNIVTSWLFELSGYLDGAIDNFGLSARTALQIDPLLDVALWIRISTRNQNTPEDLWVECGMVWWIRANSGVNITPLTRPPEAAAWGTILTTWGVSIDEAFGRMNEAVRNRGSVQITAEDGTVSAMPAGQHLVHQRSMIDNILGVLS